MITRQIAPEKRRYVVFAAAALLLFVALLRVQHVVDFVEWPDEIHSLWRVQFDFNNMLIRTPSDWPPLYGILTWIWVRIAGSSLEASRVQSVLFSLLGAALLYRAAFHLTRSTTAALISGMAYATMGYLIFAGVDVRAYGLLLALGAFAFWEMLRWLDRAAWRRGMILAVTLAFMFYTSFTALPFIAYLTLWVLVMRPRLFPRWIVISTAVVVLCLPVIPQFLNYGMARISDRLVQTLPDPGSALIAIYHDFGGSYWFLGLLAVAVVLVIWRAIRLPEQRRWIALLLLWLVVPLVVYFATHNQEFMKPRYMWWVSLGLALLIGYAALQLPQRARLAGLVLVALLPIIPVNFDVYRLAVITAPPFRETFSWFAKNIRPGDVLVIDPNCACGENYGWDYFVPQYFPTGYLPIVERPGDVSRVWYLSTTGWPRDEALLAEVEDGRRESIFYGPWFFLLRLYEGPPSWEGVSFDGRVRLNGAEIDHNNTVMGKDESFQVKLWWSAQEKLDLDYSISVAVLDRRGQVVAQVDAPAKALNTPEQTSAWEPGTYYEDYRDFRLPSDLEDGTYTLVVAVYQWWDNVRLVPEANDLWTRTGDNSSYLVLRQIQVVS